MRLTLEEDKQLSLTDTDMIFDTQFHPTKHDMIAISTIEGDVKM